MISLCKYLIMLFLWLNPSVVCLCSSLRSSSKSLVIPTRSCGVQSYLFSSLFLSSPHPIFVEFNHCDCFFRFSSLVLPQAFWTRYFLCPLPSPSPASVSTVHLLGANSSFSEQPLWPPRSGSRSHSWVYFPFGTRITIAVNGPGFYWYLSLMLYCELWENRNRDFLVWYCGFYVWHHVWCTVGT